MRGEGADIELLFIKGMISRRYPLDYVLNLDPYERMIHWAVMLDEGGGNDG